MINRLARGFSLARGKIIVEFFADDLFHEPEAVEGIAGISDAAAVIGLAAILFDITARQRRAAQHDRDLEALARHLFEILAHHHGRFDEQARHADGIGLVLLGGLEDRRDRLLDAEIDDLVAVVGEDDIDKILADIVNIALHRREHDRAALMAFGLLHEGLEIGDGSLHRLGRLQHERQLHLTGAEELTDHLHAVEQEGVDDLERRMGFERLRQILIESLAVAVDDALREPRAELGRALFLLCLDRIAILEKADKGLQRIGAIAPAIEDQILGGFTFGRRNCMRGDDLRDVEDRGGEAAFQRVVEIDRIQHGARRRIEAEEIFDRPKRIWHSGSARAICSIPSRVSIPSLRSSALPVQIVKVSGSISRSLGLRP